MSLLNLQASISENAARPDFFRSHGNKLLMAVRVATLDQLPPVCREIFELFSESPDFPRIGDCVALPSPAEADRYLLEEYCRAPSKTRECVLRAAVSILELPGTPV